MNDINTNSNKFKLLDNLIIIAKNSRMVILVSMAVTIITYLILFILPNKYNATARLMPPQQNMTLSGQLLEALGGGLSSVSGNMGGGMGGMAASLLGFRSPGELYVGIMESDTVLDRIIKRFDLMEVYSKNYIEEARRSLKKESKITAGKKDGIITIEVISRDPKRSAEMANAFIQELDRLLQEISIQEANTRLAFLEKERLQATNNLTKAEESLRSFSEKNSVLQIDTQTRGVLEYIARLRAEIDSKEVGIQVLRQQATPYNFDVVRMETEIKGLKEKLRSAETQYDNCITDVCVPTSKAPGLALEYVRLYREAKFQEALYQLFLKLVEIARLDLIRDNAIIQIIDTAKPPEQRCNQRLLPSILVGMVAFVLMVTGTFIRERVEDVKNDPDYVERISVLKEYLKPWGDMLAKIKRFIPFIRKS